MADPLQDELRRVVQNYGDGILEDPAHLGSLLPADSDPGRVRALLAAVEAEVPMLLRMTPDGANLDGRLEQLQRRMVRLGLASDDAADYAVRSWAYALQLADDPTAALVGVGAGLPPGPDGKRYDVDVVDWPSGAAGASGSATSPKATAATDNPRSAPVGLIVFGVCAAVLLLIGIGFVAATSSTSSSQAARTPAASPVSPGNSSGGGFPDTGSAGPCPAADKPAVKTDSFVRPTGVTIDPNRKWTATFDTSCGSMTFALDGGSSVDLNNFAYLAKSGFYDNTIFHRLVPGAILAGGDPLGPDPSRAGTGNPGYVYPGAAAPTGPDRYPVGTLLVDNESTPATNGSRFIIITGDDGKKLPARYTVLGHLTDGRDVLANLARMPATSDGDGIPVIPLVVRHIDVAPS